MENANYCGLDVSLRTHKVCLLSGSQELIRRFSVNNDLEGFKEIENSISNQTKICLEPTGVYSVNVFLYFKNKGFDIKFCGTYSSKKFREAMYGSRKHDNLDSVSLAKYRIVNENLTFSNIPFIEKMLSDDNYEGNPMLHELREKYDVATKISSHLKTKIKLLIDLRFPEAIQIFKKDRGSKAILKVLQCSKKEVLEGNFKVAKFEEIKSKLNNTVGQYDYGLNEFKNLVNKLENAEKEKKFIVGKLEDELKKHKYSSLLNLCGFKTANTVVFIDEIVDIKRFFRFNSDGVLNKKRSLSVFKGFLGLKTTSNQSGEREGGHKLVKSGNKKLRCTLFLLAMSCISFTKDYGKKYETFDPYKYRRYYEELIKRKKKMIALIKVMSKIATDLFFILKEIEDKNIS